MSSPAAEHRIADQHHSVGDMPADRSDLFLASGFLNKLFSARSGCASSFSPWSRWAVAPCSRVVCRLLPASAWLSCVLHGARRSLA
mmetsp:Transcript_9682/g.31144  ORF Transcript_9682/g.31144 Transcript_9682/m.31144 type:complete len:86 (-) Transcript_9682:1066-1323(-)